MASANYRQWIGKVSQRIGVIKDGLGAAFVGVVHGLMPDILADGASRATRSPWMTVSDQPDDAVALLGIERQLPRYLTEAIAQYRARVLGAWDAYLYAGDEQSILGQLALAGHPGCVIYDPMTATFSPNPYWSHFIVYMPAGSHTVTAPGPPYGSFNWGDGTRYGPVGLTVDDAATIKGIIAKWKPVQWICRDIVFEISGNTYGSGHAWGDSGFAFGANTASLGL